MYMPFFLDQTFWLPLFYFHCSTSIVSYCRLSKGLLQKKLWSGYLTSLGHFQSFHKGKSVKVQIDELSDRPWVEYLTTFTQSFINLAIHIFFNLVLFSRISFYTYQEKILNDDNFYSMKSCCKNFSSGSRI